jgi:2-phospho-L-lactate/phosphoenolpyruvate guanylyltransferase
VRCVIEWRAIMPIKQGVDGKSRLDSILGNEARCSLAERMAAHVLGVLTECCDISSITILSPLRPDHWQGEWARDAGRGLNAELTAWRAGQGKAAILIIHADLPLLSVDDVRAMLEAAAQGVAVATDREGRGTNALAIADGRPLTLCFGANSRKLHCAQYPEMPVLERDGLIVDFDTPDDAQFLAARGFHI